METNEAIERFFEERDNGIWFQVLCESGTEAIEAQAWQVAKSLHRDRKEVRDAMLQLAYELVPDSPAGSEDPRQTRFRELGVWASRQPQEVQERLSASLETSPGASLGFQEAWESGLSGFRGYLRDQCTSAVEEVA